MILIQYKCIISYKLGIQDLDAAPHPNRAIISVSDPYLGLLDSDTFHETDPDSQSLIQVNGTYNKCWL